jgi:1,4-alpha-glucan branching enzyme
LAAAALVAILLVPGILPDRGSPTAERTPATDPAIPRGASDSTDDTVVCEFQFRAPDAREVCLAGDFNQWTVCKTRLTRVGEDLWTVSMELPRGRHEYMFVVDGRWVTDPDAVTTTDDGFGNRNAVLTL